MSVYSYSYEGDCAIVPPPRTSPFAALRPFVARKKARFLLVMLVQSLVLTAATSLYLAARSPAHSQQAKIMPPPPASQSVLGTQNKPSPTPTVDSTVTPSPTPTPGIEQILDTPSKNIYRIAIIGDSMVDTMGEVLEYLEHDLKKKYPNTRFLLYNYGIGAQNASDGLARFSSRLDHQDRHYLPLTEIEADVIIVGSFAYNPFSPHDRDRHWLTLTAIVQAAQRTNASIYMLAEIAPLREDFGRGPRGVNWEAPTAVEHSGRIIEQLENAIGLSKSLKVPIIDAFTPSLEDNSPQKEGRAEYVNTDDGIHPSVRGHEFISDIISSQILLP